MSAPQGPAEEPVENTQSGEFELIAALKRMIDDATAPADLVVGIGDDTAAVNVESGVQVSTTDTMVDGVHFLSQEADWKDVGWKAAVSNLSDIAAMGAEPLHALVTIGVSPGVSAPDMEHMYDGMIAAFSEFGGAIIGGDIVSSPDFFVTMALTGRARESDGQPVLLRRDAAEPGDLVGVTGKLGGSAGGLRAITERLKGDEAAALRVMHYRPAPRISEAGALVENGVRCAMDVSDGLMADLEKICAASEVGAAINAADVPVPAELTAAFGEDAIAMALTGGEDYELVFTAPFDLMDRLLARHRGLVTHIGQVVSEPDQGDRVVALDSEGNPMQIRRKGWDHLGGR